MPDINSIKLFLYSAYKGINWKKRVDRMSDQQLVAVWSRLNHKKKNDIPIVKPSDDNVIQLSLFEDI